MASESPETFETAALTGADADADARRRDVVVLAPAAVTALSPPACCLWRLQVLPSTRNRAGFYDHPRDRFRCLVVENDGSKAAW
jgi:hypothetical protein